MSAASPRIAIACPGVGRVQRGFERMFYDLFLLMRSEFDVTLFKGGGHSTADEKVPLFVHRNAWAMRALPVHRVFGRTPFHTECMLFALGLLPQLRAGAFDLVHTIDAPLTKILYRLRARFGLRFRLLYTEGTGMPPSDYPPADHTQQVSQMLLDGALAYGYRPEAMTLVPCGFYPERFAAPQSRATLRAAHGIAQDRFVILSVAALNRAQKRIHYLIDEVAALPGDPLLLLDGSSDHGDPDLVGYATRKLGERVRISHVASDRVGDLYALADVMAHVSMLESFGLSIVEAASTGLAVLTHDGPHFRWLLPNAACWIDASQPGMLSSRLEVLMADPAARQAMRMDGATAARFSWERLGPAYAALYRRAAAGAILTVPEHECRLVG